MHTTRIYTSKIVCKKKKIIIQCIYTVKLSIGQLSISEFLYRNQEPHTQEKDTAETEEGRKLVQTNLTFFSLQNEKLGI